MRRALVAAGIAMFVVGCSATAHGPDQGAALTLAGALHLPSSAVPAPTYGALLAEAVSKAAPKPKMLCDAPSLAYLIGRSRTEIPVPADLSKRRVTCATCPSSEDYRPDRTDILFDARTNRVTDVTCG